MTSRRMPERVAVFENIPYVSAVREHLIPGVPFVLKNACREWSVYEAWTVPVTGDGDGRRVNFPLLKKELRQDQEVPVVFCHRNFESSTWKLGDFFAYWEDRIEKGKQAAWGECVYLKDWHFVKNCGIDERRLEGARFDGGDKKSFLDCPYEVPEAFRDDWFNRQSLREGDDYRFVYMGPQGSVTPIHIDVLGSFSWSANLCGQKRWIFFRPEDAERLRGKEGTFLREEDLTAGDLPSHLEIIQGAGDAVFVPSRWIHQVENLSDCISVNHNWGNGSNFLTVCGVVDADRQRVRELLGGSSEAFGGTRWEMRMAVERILRANEGVDVEALCRCALRVVEEKTCGIEKESGISGEMTEPLGRGTGQVCLKACARLHEEMKGVGPSSSFGLSPCWAASVKANSGGISANGKSDSQSTQLKSSERAWAAAFDLVSIDRIRLLLVHFGSELYEDLKDEVGAEEGESLQGKDTETGGDQGDGVRDALHLLEDIGWGVVWTTGALLCTLKCALCRDLVIPLARDLCSVEPVDLQDREGHGVQGDLSLDRVTLCDDVTTGKGSKGFMWRRFWEETKFSQSCENLDSKELDCVGLSMKGKGGLVGELCQNLLRTGWLQLVDHSTLWPPGSIKERTVSDNV
uniref:JmjC domain-containing protein n=1 Tax=Chromera velia CCMP2878 TaxID=1169474 RepID=A0A0G4GRK1_9ALVE|eukprot:Cvel_5084.t1-p1 / transcript=Cvel_5084.t1 / gene=Cvel_5084 / organism=Chromera_velia_CCMP2878 / gene_product=JmjC domain-containing protein 4 homolog, putative / transcript_product=JmjC domain-containing protein 4 homolog, putative / location=Cvel_scaffold231:100405-105360(-) / protein_length=631 / sequence_SO=supercontig / SO=protein_coding / is_pseudo=false